MTDKLKALIEDLRLNHTYCGKEVILQAADAIEALQGEVDMWKATANAVVDFEKVELRAEVDRLTEENGIWLRSNNLAKEAVDRLEARLTALEGQEPVAWRWAEIGSTGVKRWFSWETDWEHYERAKALGVDIEYALAAGAAPKEQT